MQHSNWKQEKYDSVFTDICRNVQLQQLTDPDFTIEDLEAQLRDAYILQGNGWAGKGELKDIVESATIAAYEHILAEWKVSK